MAKVRVYELAKELGLESKDVLKTLKDMGEFVRSASSTIEAPVVRRLRDNLSNEAGAGKPAASGQAAPAQSAAPRAGAPKPGQMARPAAKPATPATPAAPATAETPAAPQAPAAPPPSMPP